MYYSTVLKAISAFSLSLVIFAGCKKQSSFDFDTMPCAGTVNGVLSYSEGCASNGNGTFSELTKPAANITVDIYVESSNYKGTSNGYTLYSSVQTDEQGKFSIDIPLPVNSTVSVKVSPHGFNGDFHTIEIANNQVQEITKRVWFWADYEIIDLNPNQVQLVEIEYNPQAIDADVSKYDHYAAIQFKIGMKVEKYIPVATKLDNYNKKVCQTAPNRQTYWKGAPKVNVALIVTDVKDGYRRMNIFSQTDADGVCSLNIPVREFPCQLTVSDIEVMPFDFSYKYYKEYIKNWDPTEISKYWSSSYSSTNPPYKYDYEPTTIEGYFSHTGSVSSYSHSFSVENESWTLSPMKALTFTPYDSSIYIQSRGDEWETEE